jgi:catechol 2,3-dioxygenase-like lactoylglutathione lyase family enzyme
MWSCIYDHFSQDFKRPEMNLPPIEQQVTFLYVEDLEVSARFYGELIGLEQVLDQGACRIFRVAGEGFLGLCTSRARAVVPEGVTVTFVTPEVDRWHDRLAAAGVAIEAPPAENARFRIYNFFARDPDGYLLEFQRFLDPAWPAAKR